MITIEMIDEVWANFDKFKETAEQHDFPMILMIDMKSKPLYEDLHANWDEHHAFIFMKWMQDVANLFGFKCPEFEEKK